MILTNQLHLDFIQQANHTASDKLKVLSVAQRDYYLNKSKNLLYETYAGQVEINDLIRQYLKPLIVRDKKLKGKTDGDKFITEYPKDFYKPLKVYAKAKRGTCEERKLIIRRLNSDKIERALKNDNIRRFWDFEETFGLESAKGFEVYNGDTEIQGVYLDYLKVLPDVAGPEFEKSERYINSQGQAVSTNIDLEIDNPGFGHKIVSLAVLLAQRDYGQVTEFQNKMATIVNIEKAF